MSKYFDVVAKIANAIQSIHTNNVITKWMTVPLLSMMFIPYREKLISFWAIHCMKGLEHLECVQERASRMLTDFQSLTFEKDLKDMGRLRLKTLHNRFEEVLLWKKTSLCFLSLREEKQVIRAEIVRDINFNLSGSIQSHHSCPVMEGKWRCFHPRVVLKGILVLAGKWPKGNYPLLSTDLPRSCHRLGSPGSRHCYWQWRKQEWAEGGVKSNADPATALANSSGNSGAGEPIQSCTKLNWDGQAFIPPYCLLTGCELPWEGLWPWTGQFSQLRQFLKVQRAEDPLMTTFLGAGQQVFPWRGAALSTAVGYKSFHNFSFLYIFLNLWASFALSYPYSLTLSSPNINLTTIPRIVAMAPEATPI